MTSGSAPFLSSPAFYLHILLHEQALEILQLDASRDAQHPVATQKEMQFWYFSSDCLWLLLVQAQKREDNILFPLMIFISPL